MDSKQFNKYLKRALAEIGYADSKSYRCEFRNNLFYWDCNEKDEFESEYFQNNEYSESK